MPSLLIRLQNQLKERKEIFLICFLFFFSTLALFRGVLNGKYITNVTHIFNFEPWVHYQDDPIKKGNFIMSDMVDGIGPSVDIGRSLHSGRIALWSYVDKVGRDGFANILSDFMYPIRLVSWSLLGVPLGWTLEILIKFMLGGIFTYLFLRRLKVNPWLSAAISVGYIFGSNNIATHQGGFSTVPLTAPFVFYSIERLLQSNKWLDTIWVVVSSIFLINAGFVSVSFFFAYWIIFYVLFRVLLDTRRRQLLVKFLVSLILIVGIDMIALLPTAQYFLHGINLSYRENYGLAQLRPLSILNAIYANIFGNPLSEYRQYKFGSYINISIFVGSLTVAAAFTAGVFRAVKRRDFYSLFFLASTIFLILDIYNLGFEKVEVLTNAIPLFHGNRPTYQKTVLQFFIAILGGLGLQQIIDEVRQSKNRVGILLMGLMVSILALGAYGYWQVRGILGVSSYSVKYYWINLGLQIFGLVSLAGLIWPDSLLHFIQTHILSTLKLKQVWARALFGVVFISVFLAESIVHSWGWVSYAKPEHWFPEVEMTQYLHEHLGPGRVVSLGRVAIPAMMEAYGFPVAAGRGSVPEPYERLLQTADPDIYTTHPTQTFFDPEITDLNSQIWDLADVRYFITSKRFDETTLDTYGESVLVHEFKGGKLIERLPASKHAYFVEDAVVAANYEEMVDLFTMESWDIDSHMIVMNEADLMNEDSPQLEDNSVPSENVVNSFSQENNTMRVEVSNSSPGYLLVSSFAYPGWQAFVDGEKVEFIRAYDFLMSVPISESGDHTVELRYIPQGLVLGGIISGTSLLLGGSTLYILIKKENKYAA